MTGKTKRVGRPTKEEQRLELEELREYKKLMEAKLSGESVHVQENVKEEKEYDEYYDEFDRVEIGQAEYIKVIALCPMTLNLSTGGMGRGTTYEFTKGYGDTKRIVYTHLVQIMNKHANFMNEGYFFIADKRVVQKHGLMEVYEKILSKPKIDEIIAGDKGVALDILRSTSDKQKEFVCDLIIAKMVKGEEIDLNLVRRISDISEINILEKVEEAKVYAESSE